MRINPKKVVASPVASSPLILQHSDERYYNRTISQPVQTASPDSQFGAERLVLRANGLFLLVIDQSCLSGAQDKTRVVVGNDSIGTGPFQDTGTIAGY
jgi:hypothetical protein